MILGITALLYFIFTLLGRTIQSIRAKETKGVGLIKSIFRLTLILLWILFSATALFFTAFIQSYHCFIKKELVAIVRSTPLASGVDGMRMELKLVRNGGIEKAREFMVRGDQWSIEGDILKRKDWLNFLGLHTMYNLTRVRG